MMTALWIGPTASAQQLGYERMSDVEAEQFGDFAIVNTGDFKTTKAIRRYWAKEAQRLKHLKEVSCILTGSNDAVLKVTIPARVLFAHNDSTFNNTYENTLRPLINLVCGKDAMATLIVAAYTDNNGSERYLTALSGGRARKVHSWFITKGAGPNDVRSFGFGNRVPRNNNSNVKEREKNRRVSLFLIPNKRMIKMAKKDEL